MEDNGFEYRCKICGATWLDDGGFGDDETPGVRELVETTCNDCVDKAEKKSGLDIRYLYVCGALDEADALTRYVLADTNL